MNTIRLLLKKALQAHVTAWSPDATTGLDVTVRFMRLGKKKFERKIWRQTQKVCQWRKRKIRKHRSFYSRRSGKHGIVH